jgi:hypothetical protein
MNGSRLFNPSFAVCVGRHDAVRRIGKLRFSATLSIGACGVIIAMQPAMRTSEHKPRCVFTADISAKSRNGVCLGTFRCEAA